MQGADYTLILLSLSLFGALNNLTRDPSRSARGDLRASIFIRRTALGLVAGLPAASWLILDSAPPGAVEQLQGFVFFVQAILTWRFATRDYDVAQRLSPQRCARVALLLCSVVSYFYPPLLLIWIYIARNLLLDWQHHVSMPTRMIQMYLTLYMGTWVLSGVGATVSAHYSPSVAPSIVLLGCVQISHYLKPGLSKLQLGSRWSDWMLLNKTHLLAISAYNWGWANFLPATTAHRLVRTLAPWVVALNGCTLLIEILPLFSFLHLWIYIAMLGFMSALNLAIFLLSGILFWEYLITNLAFAAILATFSAEAVASAFGLEAFFISLGVLIWPVVFKKIWHPADLAWWDGPFIGRVRWQVHGESGKVYGLYNNFMCPYEGEYGRMYGYFLVDEKIVHGHLGLVKERALVDRIQATRGDRALLDEIKREKGVSYFDPSKTTEHERFLVDMFQCLNSGVAKNVLPAWLAWLKAPGGQFFYWGRHPAYQRQEKARRIDIYYSENFFDEPTYQTLELSNRLIKTIRL